MTKLNLLNHYRRLWFFALNRYKDDNYTLLREYLAQVLIMEVEDFMPLWNKKILDVGGATGEFCRELNEKRKCDATNLDPHRYKREYAWPNTEFRHADDMPFEDNEFDLVICRGVLEHIPTEKQQESVNEMYRVTKPGGICYMLIPPWYNPYAGHGLGPFHILPFKWAKYLTELINRKKIKRNSFAEIHLYPVTFRRMQKIISKSNFKILATKDAHLRMHFLTKIPLIREVMIPAVTFILRKE